MSLNDETKKLAKEVFAAIESEKQKAYMAGYTKGLAAGVKDSEDLRNIVNKWICGFNSKLKDAPSAMDTMPVAPEPCVEGWERASLKVFFQKLNEEVDELKAAILDQCDFDDNVNEIKEILNYYEDSDVPPQSSGGKMRIAEEAADVCTVVTSLMEAIGIGFKERNEAQRRVNRHNHERGRN